MFAPDQTNLLKDFNIGKKLKKPKKAFDDIICYHILQENIDVLDENENFLEDNNNKKKVEVFIESRIKLKVYHKYALTSFQL